ncbi:MAG: metallophosphoesterase [Labilithrix sp.]|nr:metallophosphoesterase [Labilithrix sp.]MCW5814685.1 metallophosphoesterase [Labilithrix sp.]
MRRTLAIGDVHGCLEELRELLRAVDYRAGEDRLVFVGDLVDRGPDPVGVVREVRALEARGDVLAIMGNHEEKLVRWFKRVDEERTLGKKNAMTPPAPDRLAQWEAFDEEDRAWLASRPITAEAAPGWTVVHGGFESVAGAEQKPQKMLRCRWVDPETGKMIALAEGALAAPRGVVWTERWRGPSHVVYGHAVHSLESPRVDRPLPDVECWGIDTGCCFGGHLTALCLETRAITQVRAHTKYADLHGADE